MKGINFMDWLQTIDWLGILKCFIVGGSICVTGQILIYKTKLTSATSPKHRISSFLNFFLISSFCSK